jgi:hypothetical protein
MNCPRAGTRFALYNISLDVPLIAPNEKPAAVSRRGVEHTLLQRFHYFTGLQYLVATVGEVGVSAAKQ